MAAYYAKVLAKAGYPAHVVVFDTHWGTCHAVVRVVSHGKTWYFDPMYQRRTKDLSQWGRHHNPPDVIPAGELERTADWGDEFRTEK
jgi:hypothetical protein